MSKDTYIKFSRVLKNINLNYKPMGARISIQFKNGYAKSAVLSSHWGGTDFVKEAEHYIKMLRIERGERMMEPLDRLEPDVVMADFVRHITKDMSRVTSDFRLVCSTDETDNSDYGHHIIDLEKEV